MKIVTIGDLHLRRTDPLGVIEHDGINTRLKDKLEALRICIKYACELKAMIVFLGDVFDAINPPEWLKRLFWEELSPSQKLGVPIKILIGNHDRTGLTYNFSSDEKIIPKNIEIISEPKTEFVDDKKILYLPYGNHEFISECIEPSDITFGHLEISGAQLAPDNTNMRHGLSKNLFKSDITLLGHIHKFQEFRKFFGYIGSCVKCNFGEVSNKKVFGIVDTNEMSVQYIEIPQRKMYVINIKEDDADNLYLSNKIPEYLLDKGILIKFNLVGSTEWIRSIDKHKFSKRFKKALKVIIDEKRVDGNKKNIELKTVKMEDHIYSFVKDKNKDKTYLTAGLEIAKSAQEKAEETE
jgi:DNA repair exonuclease SbcCD nuclease subunit